MNNLNLTEQINWISVVDRLPDAEITVLINAKNENEPCWPGYIGENDIWYYANGDRIISGCPDYWAHMPGGPGS